eukprot:193737_1
METQMMIVVTQLMNSYIQTMINMDEMYKKRIHDLMTQKQIYHNQITNLFHKQLQNALNTIKKLNTKTNNFQPQSTNTHQQNNNQPNTNNNTANMANNLLSQPDNQRYTIHDIHNNSQQTNTQQPSKTNEIKYVCNYCSKNFTRNTLLKRHIELAHETQANINVIKDNSAIHLSQTHKNKLRGKSIYSNRKRMNKIKRKQMICSSDEDNHNTSESERSRSRSRLKRAILEDMDDSTSGVSDLSDGEMDILREKIDKMSRIRLKCPRCGKPGINKNGLKRHLLVHTQRRPFKCDWCKNTFKRDISLKLHKKQHCKFRHKYQ